MYTGTIGATATIARSLPYRWARSIAHSRAASAFGDPSTATVIRRNDGAVIARGPPATGYMGLASAPPGVGPGYHRSPPRGRSVAWAGDAMLFYRGPASWRRIGVSVAPVCSNCGASDFVWANDLKTGSIGGGTLSLRSRGELSIGTRICRSCGHADLFLKDPSILKMPHTWKPGEFVPIPAPAAHHGEKKTEAPYAPAPSVSPPPPPSPPAPPPSLSPAPPPPPPPEPILPPPPTDNYSMDAPPPPSDTGSGSDSGARRSTRRRKPKASDPAADSSPPPPT